MNVKCEMSSNRLHAKTKKTIRCMPQTVTDSSFAFHEKTKPFFINWVICASLNIVHIQTVEAEVNTFMREQLRKEKERLITRNQTMCRDSRNYNAKQVNNQPQERPVVVLYDLRAAQKVTCDAWTYLHSASSQFSGHNGSRSRMSIRSTLAVRQFDVTN